MEHHLREIEQRYYASSDATLLAEARPTINLFDEAAHLEVCYLGKTARAKCYGEEDRVGKTLANLLRRTWASEYIVELDDNTAEPQVSVA
ncbi:hypothetical protein NDU88_004405 [Pleurodeles waltl]|uniref:Uncharacterized protein n=1 Tax=Pleurodeles waltl TaxID=8319 RepID=A0AAV7UF70_PLEWA|nr:hypothetical protein NDU88_004405 [Pleurodeles waltl]